MKKMILMAVAAAAAFAGCKEKIGPPDDETGGFYLEKKANVGTNIMRASHGIVMGGDIYYIDSGGNNDMWVYNVASNRWTQKAANPGGRQKYAFENKIYTLEGLAANPDIHRYSAETNEWIICGRLGDGDWPECYRKQPVTLDGTTYWTDPPSLPVIVKGTRAYATDGWGRVAVREYDARLDKWTEKTSFDAITTMTGDSFAASQFLFDNEIYVYTVGRSGAFLWRYDEAADSVSHAATLKDITYNTEEYPYTPPVTVGDRVFFGPYGNGYYELKRK